MSEFKRAGEKEVWRIGDEEEKGMDKRRGEERRVGD